jgi:hypothetical protein
MAAVFLCATISDPAQAAPPGQFMLYGSGGVSCGKWLAQGRSKEFSDEWIAWQGDLGWVLGWLSAAGYYDVRGNLRETDKDAVVTRVDKYCREHPRDNIHRAAKNLVDELSMPK